MADVSRPARRVETHGATFDVLNDVARRAAMRISVSSWATDEEDGEQSLQATLRIAKEAD